MINSVVLVGRLTKDPDFRYLQNGKGVATFTLACNRQFKNSNGNRDADFINCVIWEKKAENLANMTKKGTLIGITGRIQTRNYENSNGNRVYVTEVLAESFQLLESRNSNDYGTSHPANSSFKQEEDPAFVKRNQTQNKLTDFDRHSDPFMGSSIDISEDDLPF